MFCELENVYNICNVNQLYQHSHQKLDLIPFLMWRFFKIICEKINYMLFVLFIFDRADVIL